MKKSQKHAKKTMAEVMQDRLTKLSDTRKEKMEREAREKHRPEEDEVMAMTYGPNWRDAVPKGDEEEMKRTG